jgi:hypothetical protein
MDRREHHRVQLRIPARLRLTMPLGQTTEICETWNVSRGGLLVPCKQNHVPGTPLWITFPYDITLPFGQPEVLAHVVRSELVARRAAAPHNADAGELPGGNIDTVPAMDPLSVNGEMVFASYAALQLEIKARTNKGKNGYGHGNGNVDHREVERRTSVRRAVAVPIRVRLENVPWFEEAMTIDASKEGLRFVSCREYQPGQHLVVSFEDAVLSPWPVATEFHSLVARVDALPPSSTLAVTIYRLQ